MKFIALQSGVKEAISIVGAAIGDGINLPVLKNILIKIDGENITFSATNLEISTTHQLSGKVIEPGSITIPVSVLVNIINNLKSERLNFEVKGNILEIKTDNYSAKIQGTASDDFPPTPKIKNSESFLEIKSIFLREAIQQVVVAAQMSDFRPELSAIFFDFSIETIKLAATDGFRLAEKTIPTSNFTAKETESFKMLIPLKTAHEVQRVMSDSEVIRIYHDENQVLFRGEHTEIISRLIEGNFPEYSQIIPGKFISEVSASADELLSGIKLASVFGQKNGEVELRVNPSKKTLEIVSADQALGENAYLLPAKIKGDAIEVVFNWRYLADSLRAIKTGDVSFGFQAEANPAIVRPTTDASYFYIIKPILKA
jgi:DNA polymerase-3 subunit beta